MTAAEYFGQQRPAATSNEGSVAGDLRDGGDPVPARNPSPGLSSAFKGMMASVNLPTAGLGAAVVASGQSGSLPGGGLASSGLGFPGQGVREITGSAPGARDMSRTRR